MTQSAFVPKERIPVTLDGVNIIYIRPKMDFATRKKAEDAILHVARNEQNEADVTAHQGNYLIALAKLNFVGWEGPMFEDERGRAAPCTPYNIEQLDPDLPLLEAALHEIAVRNPLDRRQGPDGGTTDLPLRPPEQAESEDPEGEEIESPPLARTSSVVGGSDYAASSTDPPGNGTSISTSPNGTGGSPEKFRVSTPIS